MIYRLQRRLPQYKNNAADLGKCLLGELHLSFILYENDGLRLRAVSFNGVAAGADQRRIHDTLHGLQSRIHQCGQQHIASQPAPEWLHPSSTRYKSLK